MQSQAFSEIGGMGGGSIRLPSWFNNHKHLPHPQQNRHPTPTHSPKCSTTGKNPLRPNGLLSARNGPLSEHLASACEEWEFKVKSVEISLSTSAA